MSCSHLRACWFQGSEALVFVQLPKNAEWSLVMQTRLPYVLSVKSHAFPPDFTLVRMGKKSMPKVHPLLPQTLEFAFLGFQF